ncbi:hypothetical protein ARSQ2_02110 [Arsenophonus endosymbiont of Bemisia tabaci Q2]|nr:hypothetical protein ARSQ2_00586 [Arsenophonus endosymbiont of Bemisia tabaci Q2]CAA2930970.1 hypothetical protein ARSQ2_02110 [Arsenophonus endosymbiont of Bemisia tabaci Q2]
MVWYTFPLCPINFLKILNSLVKTGDIITVKVINIDLNRKRIALSMRLDEKTTDTRQQHRNKPQTGKNASSASSTKTSQRNNMPFANSVMADALAAAALNKKR